jgi:hypothetical protein
MAISFFIGHHKTGSTALQAHFARHRIEYLRRGLLYPMVESRGMAVMMAEAISGQSHFDKFPSLNLREPHNALAFRLLNEAIGEEIPPWHPNLPSGMDMFRTIQAQIVALKPAQVVLCSEVMSRFPLEGAAQIMPRLSANFGNEEINLVLNLRRPDLYLASWHLQRLKFGHHLVPLRLGGYGEYLTGAHFRYDAIVVGYARALPHARIFLRNYDDVRAKGGSIPDFMAQIEVEPIPHEEERSVNASVPYALGEVVRLMGLRAPKLVLPLVNYIIAAGDRIAVPRNEEVELFGPDHRATLMKAFAPIHRAISERAGGTDFFPDIEAMGQVAPMPELIAAEIGLALLKADIAEFGEGALRSAVLSMGLEAVTV